jgi:hypothetical protein
MARSITRAELTRTLAEYAGAAAYRAFYHAQLCTRQPEHDDAERYANWSSLYTTQASTIIELAREFGIDVSDQVNSQAAAGTRAADRDADRADTAAA